MSANFEKRVSRIEQIVQGEQLLIDRIVEIDFELEALEQQMNRLRNERWRLRGQIKFSFYDPQREGWRAKEEVFDFFTPRTARVLARNGLKHMKDVKDFVDARGLDAFAELKGIGQERFDEIKRMVCEDVS